MVEILSIKVSFLFVFLFFFWGKSQELFVIEKLLFSAGRRLRVKISGRKMSEARQELSENRYFVLVPVNGFFRMANQLSFASASEQLPL